MTPTEICEKVNAGDLSPLLAYVRLKELEKELENAINQIKDQAIDEAERFGQKSFDFHGAKIEVKNAASRWDYSNCYQVQAITNKLKVYQTLAQQAAQSKEPIYDSEGTAIDPAIKIEGKTTIAVSLLK